MKRGGSSVHSYKNDETVSRGREAGYVHHQACQQRWNSGNQMRSTFSIVQLLWSIESERQNRLPFVSVIDPQMVRSCRRAGARRQWRLVRHGTDRVTASCRPRAQHQLGRGHPLRRAHDGVLRPNTARTLVTQGVQQPLAQLWRGTTWRFVWCAERIPRGSSCRAVALR
jgi:hypothetical protein